MLRVPIRLAACVLLSVVAAFSALGQVQQQGTAAGKLVVANPRATAIAEYDAAYDAYQAWSWTESFTHAQRALAMDSSFALARALVARERSGPTAAAELQRAAIDAAKGPAPEAVLALAMRGGSPSVTATLWNTAVELAPNDPRIALERALAMTGGQRIEALRDASKKFPNHAATKQWLAFYLTPTIFADPAQADGAEALAAAQEAVRLAPNTSGSHTAVAHVLEHLRRDDEALKHLAEATSMAATNEYAFVLRAEILEHQGKIPEARAALDSAILLTDNLVQAVSYRTDRALTFLHEGNLAATRAAMDENIRIADANTQRGAAADAHRSIAIIEAGANNTKAANEHFAIARRLGATPGALADGAVIIYALTRQAIPARKALEDYIALAQQAPPSEVRDQNIHRMTGLTLLAEGKPSEAIAELKQGGPNPYSQLGIVEAYTQLGKKKEADAERASFLARKDFSVASSAMAIAKYRTGKK